MDEVSMGDEYGNDQLKDKAIRDIKHERHKTLKELYGESDRFYFGLAYHTYGDLEKKYRANDKLDDVYGFEADLDRIDEVIQYTSYALTPWSERKADSFQSWYHREIVSFGKHKTPNSIDKGALETAVGIYLAGTFRSQQFDRLFVDMLVTEEYVAFINDPRSNINAFQKPLLRGFIAGRLNATLILAATWALVAYASSQNWIGPDTVGWALGLPAAFWLFGTVFAIWAVVNHGAAYTATRKKIMTVLEAMASVHSEIGSTTGYLSSSHIHQRIKDASAKGVVWNGQLHVLMEDIEARSKTF